MFEAAVSGARTDEIEGVEVVVRPALTAAAAEVLEADGYLLGTPSALALGNPLETGIFPGQSVPAAGRVSGPVRRPGRRRRCRPILRCSSLVGGRVTRVTGRR